MKPKTIGLLGFDGVMALDLIGPSDAFASAIDDSNGQPSSCYEVVVIGLTNKPFVSESGVIFRPHKTILNAPALDTLIIPGGKGLREPETQRKVAEWVGNRIKKIRRIATVCTGIYGLAPTGVLDGCRVTTHWRFARDLAARFPKLKVDVDAIFLKNGRVHTCAGVTSGIDLSLALIEEDYGPRVALAVARELVVYLKRPGGQEQFSEPLQFQTESTDRFGDLAAWMQGHLHQDLSVETLADKACLCSRQFSRRFKKAFGSTPAAFVEELRLGEARQRLGAPNNTIETVAASVGFKSADAFRRAFERRFGVKPSSYRKHFAFEHQKPRILTRLES
jgi:transcriptional regulator GlxA family with amidase domain